MHFKDLMSHCSEHDDAVQAIKVYFKGIGRFYELEGDDIQSFQKERWPNSAGVYVIRDKATDEILYIGMCGKLQGIDGALARINKSTFGDRAQRWTPYVFQKEGENVSYWECGPNFKPTFQKPSPSKDNYRWRFHLSNIVVECFCIDADWHHLSPSFLEALVLQAYVSRTSKLPLGNNEF